MAMIVKANLNMLCVWKQKNRFVHIAAVRVYMPMERGIATSVSWEEMEAENV